MDGKLYHESQTVMPVMAALLTAILSVGIVIFTAYLMGTDAFEIGSVAGMTMIISLAAVLILSVALFFIRIKTTVTQSSLTVGMFKGRNVPISDIESVSTEDFSAFKDYLGWGIKIGRKGLGYIAAGTNKGLRIHLKGGKSFFISSKKIFEFESAMKMVLKYNKDR
ncbi:MAG: hypothetical protein LBE48_03580 [Methanomassiliicoccaceae archaeon]|nr:hypothetical protein [Methanomassiliicoccaceae archaeon]